MDITFDGIIVIFILIMIFLLIYCKVKNTTLKQAILEIKEIFTSKE